MNYVGILISVVILVVVMYGVSYLSNRPKKQK